MLLALPQAACTPTRKHGLTTLVPAHGIAQARSLPNTPRGSPFTVRRANRPSGLQPSRSPDEQVPVRPPCDRRPGPARGNTKQSPRPLGEFLLNGPTARTTTPLPGKLRRGRSRPAEEGTSSFRFVSRPARDPSSGRSQGELADYPAVIKACRSGAGSAAGDELEQLLPNSSLRPGLPLLPDLLAPSKFEGCQVR